MSEDLYQVLGVSRNADESEIKKAYKKLALTNHPDRGGDAETFKKINEAYSILSDAEKRQKYDRCGSVEGMDNMNDFFQHMFGGGGGFPFPGMGGGVHVARRQYPNKQMDMKVTLEEVMKGATIPFRVIRKKYQSSKSCHVCKGSGQVIQQMNLGIGFMTQSISACSHCQGLGTQIQEHDATIMEEIIQVPLPSGIPDGGHLVIRQKGDEYPNQTTDVIVTVRYQKHSFFIPRGLNLECELTITLKECLHGFQRTIPLLNKTNLQITKTSALVTQIKEPLKYTIHGYGFSYRGQTGHISVTFVIDLLNQPVEYPLIDSTRPLLHYQLS